MTLIEQICAQHSGMARTVWEKRGRLIPKLFAQGIDRMVIAEPFSIEAIDTTNDEIRATLCIALALKVEAVAVGRSDEAFIRTMTPETLRPGALLEIADFDPEVRTCLITETIAIGGSEEVTYVATHGLDDHGRHDWTITRSVNGTMGSLVPLRVARDMIADGLPDFWRDPEALGQFARQVGWTFEIVPQPAL